MLFDLLVSSEPIRRGLRFLTKVKSRNKSLHGLIKALHCIIVALGVIVFHGFLDPRGVTGRGEQLNFKMYIV